MRGDAGRFRNRRRGLRDQWRAGTIGFSDINAPSGGPFFYRVRRLIGTDPRRGQLRRPHHIDLKTGMYGGRQMLKTGE